MSEHEREYARWDEAAQLLRQHRPTRRHGSTAEGRPLRCSCGYLYEPLSDYDQAVANHQAAEFMEALGQPYPLGVKP